jgi:hypothetical protein
LLDGREAIAAARQHLVGIGLAPNVPDQTVVRCVKDDSAAPPSIPPSRVRQQSGAPI